MNKLICLFVTLLCVTITTSNATLIANDMTNLPTSGVLNFTYHHDINFSVNSDGAQIYQQGVDAIPDALLDRSLFNASDNLGILTADNSAPFFGLVDTTNIDNPSGEISATWTFDINGFTQLLFSIDIAAMGDFEHNDTFSWQYQLDGSGWQTLFSSAVDETTVQRYQMQSGSDYLIDDPMILEGRALTNRFSQYDAKINGNGQLLDIRLSATTNGGNEVIAFQNLLLSGQVAETIPEPSTPMNILMAMALMGAIRQLKHE